MLCDNLEGWDRVGGGRGGPRGRRLVSLWLIHIVARQKPTQHCKAIRPQLEINKSKGKMIKKTLQCRLSLSGRMHESECTRATLSPSPEKKMGTNCKSMLLKTGDSCASSENQVEY